MADIIHKDLSYIVNGCIFEVHNEVGPGLREECYQNEIHGTKLPRSPITPIQVDSDFLVEVEALHETITARAIRTMQCHLKFTGARIGIVVNFGKTEFAVRGVRPAK